MINKLPSNGVVSIKSRSDEMRKKDAHLIKENKPPIVGETLHDKQQRVIRESDLRTLIKGYERQHELQRKRIMELEGRIKRILDVIDDQCPYSEAHPIERGEVEHDCCQLEIGHDGPHKLGID